MKKILLIIVLSILLSFTNHKSAQALVIDFGQIAAKLSEVAEDITDTIGTGMEEINKIKQMGVQGFSFEELQKYGMSILLSNAQAKRSKKGIDKGTNAQNKQILTSEMEDYKEASHNLYDNQIKQTSEDMNKVCSQISATQSELADEQNKESQTKAEYESATDPIEKQKKFDEYTKHSSNVQKLTADLAELQASCAELEEQKNKLQEEKDIVDNDEDEQYKALQARLDAMEDETDSNQILVIDTDNEEWDKVSADKYVLGGKVYEDFIKKYFYNPEDLGENSKNDTNAHQSRIDRVMRQRRFLVVNTAAHLLQVAASIRREIPSHYKHNDDIFNTLNEGNEYAVMQTYSATRVESAKALLLYAKLLCAKLQYLAAHDLLKVDPKKNIDGKLNDVEFDLSKYILTKDDVKAMTTKFSYQDAKSSKEKVDDYNTKSDDTPEFLKYD